MLESIGRVFDRFRHLPEIEGYEHPELLNVVYRKALAYRPNRDWPEMRGVSTVLDFGGGCGHHYRDAVGVAPLICWAVVETPGMVARAADLATDRLRFFSNIEDAKAWLGNVDVMHSNGALQYAADPVAALRSLCRVGAERMIWRRVALSNGTMLQQVNDRSHLRDSGPGHPPAGTKSKTVKLVSILIPEAAFLKTHTGYALTERGEDWFNFRRA